MFGRFLGGINLENRVFEGKAMKNIISSFFFSSYFVDYFFILFLYFLRFFSGPRTGSKVLLIPLRKNNRAQTDKTHRKNKE